MRLRRVEYCLIARGRPRASHRLAYEAATRSLVFSEDIKADARPVPAAQACHFYLTLTTTLPFALPFST